MSKSTTTTFSVVCFPLFAIDCALQCNIGHCGLYATKLHAMHDGRTWASLAKFCLLKIFAVDHLLFTSRPIACYITPFFRVPTDSEHTHYLIIIIGSSNKSASECGTQHGPCLVLFCSPCAFWPHAFREQNACRQEKTQNVRLGVRKIPNHGVANALGYIVVAVRHDAIPLPLQLPRWRACAETDACGQHRVKVVVLGVQEKPKLHGASNAHGICVVAAKHVAMQRIT